MKKLIILLLLYCSAPKKYHINESILLFARKEYSLARPGLKYFLETSDKNDLKNYKIFLIYLMNEYESGNCGIEDFDKDLKLRMIENLQDKYVEEIYKIFNYCESFKSTL